MLLWCDGFDHYGSGAGGVTKMLDGAYAQVTSGTPSNTRVRTGLYSFGMPTTGSAQFFRRIFGANKSIAGFGCAVYLDNLPSGSGLYLAKFLNGAGTAVCTITVNTVGALEIRTGSESGTVRATSSPAIVAAAWQHFECKVAFSATVGACEIRVNGVTVMNVSNINTDNAGGGVASNLSCGHLNSAGSPMYVDDVFAWDTSGTYNNDFIGDKKCYTLFPDADTAVADWVPDTGTAGFSRINEATPSDVSYIDGQTVGDISEFAADDLNALVTSIAGITTYNRAIKTDAGDSNVQVSLISNGAAAVGTDTPVTTTYTYWMDVFEENPDTNSAWTRSAVNAMLIREARTL